MYRLACSGLMPHVPEAVILIGYDDDEAIAGRVKGWWRNNSRRTVSVAARVDPEPVEALGTKEIDLVHQGIARRVVLRHLAIALV